MTRSGFNSKRERVRERDSYSCVGPNFSAQGCLLLEVDLVVLYRNILSFH